MLADFALPCLALLGAEPRAYALTQAVRHYLIRGSRSGAKVGLFIGPGPRDESVSGSTLRRCQRDQQCRTRWHDNEAHHSATQRPGSSVGRAED